MYKQYSNSRMEKEGCMKENTISASQISSWLFCPISFRLSYYDLKEKQLPNIYMVWGSAMHEALEENFKQKIKTKKDLSLKEVQKVFEESFNCGSKNYLKMPYGNAEPNTLALVAENVLAKYMIEIAPAIQPKYVEHEFRLQLKKYPIIIHGFIDLITEDNKIKDYKTVGKNNREWTQYKADDSIQLTFYAAAYRKMFLKREVGIEIDLIPRDNKPEFRTLSTSRTDEQVDYVLHLASVIQELKDRKIYHANLINCRNCPYNQICPKK